MAAPTPDEVRRLLSRHVQFWNERRFDDWMALWPDDAELEDPVGTPTKNGKQAAFAETWNESNTGWRLEITNLVVVGNEAAMATRTTGNVEGQEAVVDAIDFYTFGDGTVRGRVFFNAPA